jgi:hypothetical protein
MASGSTGRPLREKQDPGTQDLSLLSAQES